MKIIVEFASLAEFQSHVGWKPDVSAAVEEPVLAPETPEDKPKPSTKQAGKAPQKAAKEQDEPAGVSEDYRIEVRRQLATLNRKAGCNRAAELIKELTGADIEKSTGCLTAAGRWVFILVMAFLAYLIGFKFRAIFPVAAILVALPITPWQDLLTDKLHMSIWAKLCAGAAFAIAGMYFTKPPRLALAGLLLILAIVLAVMDASKGDAAEPEAEEASAPEPEAEKPAEPETKINRYIVAGVQYYMDNLMTMVEENYLYAYKKQELIDICRTDEKIYKQIFTPSHLDLTHEPDNPHDPNAIKVMLDNKLVGYIRREDCKHILDIMDNDLFVSANCEVTGGKYKMVNEDYDCIKDKSTYKMETGEDDYAIYIYIRERVM